jgi:hypothetical protein
MNKRLAAAMGAYAVLIAIAVYLLRGKLLYAVLILFGGLVAKTLIAAKAGWLFHSGTSLPESDSETNQSALFDLRQKP